MVDDASLIKVYIAFENNQQTCFLAVYVWNSLIIRCILIS